MTQRKATPGSILDDLMSAAPAGVAKPAASSLRIADIRRDGGTQPRAGLDDTHVADLVAALANGDELPPVDVVFDGTAYWLYDGFHRVEATSRSGKYTVQAVIHQGTQQDAQWASYAANSRHGLKRTNDDKRRQVIAALKHPAGASMSNREIARHVGVDEGTVRTYREQMTVSAEIPQMTERTVNRGGQTYTQNTAGQREAAQRRQQRDDAAEDTWQPAQDTPRYQPPAGRPMMEVLRTAAELAAEAEAADIASREAAADEAARQARDQAFQDRMASEAAARRDAEYARQAEREAAAIATTDAAFGMAQTTRHAQLLHVLEQAMAALPEIGDLIRQRQFCLSVVVTLETMHRELRNKVITKEVKETPAATELPADLVAHGWELRRTRDGGRWIAAILPPDEEQEITTVKRGSIADVIGDCRYMERNLQIGVQA